MEIVALMGVSNLKSVDVWNRRLGHHASKAMEILHLYGSRNNSDFYNKTCNILFAPNIFEILFL